ncbi:large subunit ribosomal protein L13 [Treponema rectale]|uniref:Large ribosomal subunit protein uL13 n=1 Tax=Treponema rectale TaxID=744512 RepID=A0A840SJ70_9SPIR|nr:50S ribosomal protein L13 [Treponema rectale]MBB5219431.1 large subunit ribosomal protein L13 [Treponema rectale]
MKTIFAKESELKHDWYVIDAAGKTLGRVAVKAASLLRGKNKPSYTPNAACGGYVIIINADKVVVTGNKGEGLKYRHHTGYVRGLTTYSFDELLERKPTDPLERTIAGMLPHNRLGRQLFRNLKVYAGSEHPHAAQNPKTIEF